VRRNRTSGSQERGYVRVKAALKVTAVDREGRAAAGQTIEISGNGALISLNLNQLRLEAGNRLQLLISLPERPIIVDANVLRSLDTDVYPVEFERIDNEERERLIAFVFERLRKRVSPGAQLPAAARQPQDAPPTPAPETAAATPSALRRLLAWLWS
jgi:c-di-GMP-binding flagellar brake protein YcgR